jgi:hypothetical protein
MAANVGDAAEGVNSSGWSWLPSPARRALSVGRNGCEAPFAEYQGSPPPIFATPSRRRLSDRTRHH